LTRRSDEWRRAEDSRRPGVGERLGGHEKCSQPRG
jgi:hypothetical protein